MHGSAKLFSIGELSKISGISIKALRYYHNEGILVPAYINSKTGYRYYTSNQLLYTFIIKICRELGLSIEELRDLFESAQTKELLNYIIQRKKKTENQIAQLQSNLKKLTSLESTINYSFQAMDNDGITLTEFPKRYLLKLAMNASEEPLDYAALEKLARTYGIHEIYNRGIFYEKGHAGTLRPSFVFLLINEKDFKMNSNDFFILPAGNFLTISYDKNDELEKLRLLGQYVKDNNLHVDYGIELDLYYDVFNTSSYACQTQLYINENNQ
ncbi:MULTISPECIES: MerR family transcriptional regulator [Bacillus]|uniref:MerR family transcriptional regulator n=1 Tax=Bacillus TaxID=1386 RepID=UPI0002EE7E0F|nr:MULTISPECIES: helix-turn-helix domain-containing protein [Bacillus]